MLKKIIKLNNDGSIGVGIPAKVARELGITNEDYVNMERVGNCLHITKVHIE
jgi:antitoxin component of MazEF toxin-antitoxin module